MNKSFIRVTFILLTILLSVSLNACSDKSDEPQNPNGSEEGASGKHEYVDLGLSVKWATCNIGAEKASDYGDYFAWGETETKSNYTDRNSQWYEITGSELHLEDVIDSKYNLTSQYDAATANWGSQWRMPTLDEIMELLNSCTWTWTENDGKNGYEVTGPNGNSIFLPAAGYRGSSGLSFGGSYGTYWSATVYGKDYGAYSFSINSSGHSWDSFSRRYHGQSVRPVTE